MTVRIAGGADAGAGAGAGGGGVAASFRTRGFVADPLPPVADADNALLASSCSCLPSFPNSVLATASLALGFGVSLSNLVCCLVICLLGTSSLPGVALDAGDAPRFCLSLAVFCRFFSAVDGFSASFCAPKSSRA